MMKALQWHQSKPASVPRRKSAKVYRIIRRTRFAMPAILIGGQCQCSNYQGDLPRPASFGGLNCPAELTSSIGLRQDHLSVTELYFSLRRTHSAPQFGAGYSLYFEDGLMTFIIEELPVAVVAPVGSTVSLSSILTQAFGPDFDGYNQFWITYYGAAELQTTISPLSYWDPVHPSITTWLMNGVPLTESPPNGVNWQYLTTAQVGSYELQIGNNILPMAYLLVPISIAGGTEVYRQFDINVVAPGLQNPTAGNGIINPNDVVAAAGRYATAYSGVLNAFDCHDIACDVAAAAGAPLDENVTFSIDPTTNLSAGFWRVAYRGSDPNPVAHWQTLVQPGDIVRMGWQAGLYHTTTVLSRNTDGSITVIDNGAQNSLGQSVIGIHTVYYDNFTVPDTITIYRLSSDHLYLLNGSDQSEILNGSQFNNEIHTSAGNDIVNAGPGNDFVYLDGTGTKSVDGDAGLNTVVLSGLHSSYGISENGTSLTLAGAGVSAQLANVQQIEFSDGTFIYPTTGNHSIVASIPHSTILFDGGVSQFQIVKNGDGSLTIADSVAGRDGTNHVLDVDYLQFTDKMLIVATADNANIARLYSAALDRAPDTGGLSGWEDIYAHNISTAAKVGGVYQALAQTADGYGSSIAGGFTQSIEFQSKYGALTDGGFLTQLYLNVLNRTPATTEINDWLNLMHNGDANGTHFTRDMVLVGFAESPENIAKTAADWLIQV
jgi:Domain of unknown function (DUF4214)/RTX calcium-binding nonapeptide repeat (4 copies)